MSNARMEEQLSVFNERIKRIEDPRNTYYQDAESGINIPKRVSRVLGILCLAAARYVRFNIAGIADEPASSHIVMLMDFGVAAIITFILGGFLKQKSTRHMTAQVAGIAVMAFAMHNLVWMYPAEFAQVFTQAYVEEVQGTTTPNTLYIGGTTYDLPVEVELASL